MNEKKLARKKNKVQKMAALVNLVNHEDEGADGTTSNQLSAHEKVEFISFFKEICILCTQTKVKSKRIKFCAHCFLVGY